jgi:hypothetical protein
MPSGLARFPPCSIVLILVTVTTWELLALLGPYSTEHLMSWPYSHFASLFEALVPPQYQLFL